MKLEKGSKNLIKDLEELLAEAKDGEFSDFTNKKYDAPKMVLVRKFEYLKRKVLYGDYDEI